MEAWVERALARWPDVPALYGWLGLDRRGRWLIRGEPITRPQIVETIGRNYAADAAGRWYFQNGPQRGYVALERAPLVLRVDDAGAGLVAHTQQPVSRIEAALLDDDGGLWFATDLGPGALLDADLPWALERLRRGDADIDEDDLAEALERASGTATALVLRVGHTRVAVERLDAAAAPARLGFVREPVPD